MYSPLLPIIAPRFIVAPLASLPEPALRKRDRVHAIAPPA
jgi:hypothetical protein